MTTPPPSPSRREILRRLGFCLALVGLVPATPAAAGGSSDVRVRQLTRGPSNHFFGYIGQCRTIPWNASGRYLLALETTFQDRLPGAGDAAGVCLLDTHDNFRVRVVDRTLGWNPQQDTMFYWNPEHPETQFFFNDRDPRTGKVFTVLFDLSRGRAGERIREYRFDDTPVGNGGVAQNGGYFLAINYARMDLPGLETVTVNFHGNQGIVNFYDARMNVYHDFEPMQHGSMMMPLNWTGRTEEYFVVSPNVDEGVYDGWGRRVLRFPADGHPEMCYTVVDLTGDCRDEIVVWDPQEMWIYTQADNPKSGPLYRPRRNPLFNQSNYQANVSLPPP